MPRDLTPIPGVTDLDAYDPAAFDAVRQPDGTYTLYPVRWTTQTEFEDYAFGCGDPD